jgi:hypothetical protein
LIHFLELSSGGSYLFLQFMDAVGIGSLGSNDGILHTFEVASHLQYKLVVGINEGDSIVTGSGIVRGTTGARIFLRHAGRLRPMQGSKTPYRYAEVELVQGNSRRGVSVQLR